MFGLNSWSFVHVRHTWTHSEYLRHSIIAALTATAAFTVSHSTPLVSEPVATITALVTLRATFHESAQETARQIVGAGLGAIVAFLGLFFIRTPTVTFFVTILCTFAIARLLRLGIEGAVPMAVTLVLVFGPDFSIQAVESRLAGIVVGTVFGLVGSLFVRKGTPTRRLHSSIRTYSSRLESLMMEMSGTLARRQGDTHTARIEEWSVEAEAIQSALVDLRQSADEAVDGAKWSPLITRTEAEEARDEVVALQAIAEGVVGTCADLLAVKQDDRAHLSDVAVPVAEVIAAAAAGISGDDPTGEFAAVRKAAAREVLSLDDTQAIILGGAMIRKMEKVHQASAVVNGDEAGTSSGE